MKHTDAQLLEIAIEVAKKNPIVALPKMAAILRVYEPHYYLYGYNQLKSHPLQAKFGRNDRAIYLHAEIDAIVKATRLGYWLEDATMYIARVLKDGTPALAKPCEGCQRALMHFGIKDVIWTE